MGCSEALSHCLKKVLSSGNLDGISINANSVSVTLNKWIKPFLPKECVLHKMGRAFRDRLGAVNVLAEMSDQLGGWSKIHIGHICGSSYSLCVTQKHLNNFMFN